MGVIVSCLVLEAHRTSRKQGRTTWRFMSSFSWYSFGVAEACLGNLRMISELKVDFSVCRVPFGPSLRF